MTLAGQALRREDDLMIDRLEGGQHRHNIAGSAVVEDEQQLVVTGLGHPRRKHYLNNPHFLAVAQMADVVALVAVRRTGRLPVS